MIVGIWTLAPGWLTPREREGMFARAVYRWLEGHRPLQVMKVLELDQETAQMESVSRYQKLLQQLALDLGFLLG